MFIEKKSIEILKILGLSKKIHDYFKNLVEENISQEYRSKNIDEKRNYFLQEL